MLAKLSFPFQKKKKKRVAGSLNPEDSFPRPFCSVRLDKIKRKFRLNLRKVVGGEAEVKRAHRLRFERARG